MIKDKRPSTIFLDLDGTLVEHSNDISSQHRGTLKLLPGTIEKLQEWDRKGYRIIITTGRRESTRKYTEQQLTEAGIFYDLLIMGLGGGKRILINDRKPDSTDDTAIAFNLTRNTGIKDIDI